VTPPPDSLTWERLVELEPKLLALEGGVKVFAAAYALQRVRCANAAMLGYGDFEGCGIKDKIQKLVGWYRPEKHPILSSMRAYDIVGDRMYRLLPDCRRCNCL
jgi:hypothetical protein